ncbi:sugar ABC transporter ATP-binding protein [Dulcicalothrix desertica PCC 7102]|uniref:Sugar ABC transporter ATP-binding protein n=2 Tax=Dulcicalothrix desertica TaxID=32056 RepID=A0A433VNB9_9CYAN|nr:sugar ABC transporter ATP-binding protein [Dulcicalothrix desertica PCC 7102]
MHGVMGDELAISLQNVSKCYKRYGRPVDKLKEVLLPTKNYAQEFWALQNIDLEVHIGETVGIIGQNGSGKSTLLQIIARTLTPTTGNVLVNGRVSALLELGSGFNPEFTGRQNVFFNGRILGLSQQDIEAKFNEILAFADIGDFIDQPVKTYSSGMFVRLAFAVAVCVNPDILIVDEALAVGDVYFQQKCYERLRQLKDLGTTILFVSHDSTSVYRLCTRALLLESGKLILDNQPKQVIDLYEANLLKKNDVDSKSLEIKILSSSESISNSSNTFANEVVINQPEVDLKFVTLLDENNQEIDSIISEDKIEISIGLLFLKSFDDPHAGFKIRNKTGEVVFETNTYCMGIKIGKVESNSFVNLRFNFYVPLIEGEYTISVGLTDTGYGEGLFERTLIYAHNVSAFKVLRNKNSIIWSGVVNLYPSLSISKQAYV